MCGDMLYGGSTAVITTAGLELRAPSQLDHFALLLMIRLESFNIFPFGPFCVCAALLHTAGLSLHPDVTDSFTTTAK